MGACFNALSYVVLVVVGIIGWPCCSLVDFAIGFVALYFIPVTSGCLLSSQRVEWNVFHIVDNFLLLLLPFVSNITSANF